MKRLTLIRHGETEWNAENRVQGSVDIPLSAQGLAQAEALGEHLVRERVRFDLLYTSDLQRARRTGEIVAAKLGLGAPRLSPLLREIHCGEWEGLTVDSLHQEHREAYSRWRDDASFSCPGGESVLDVRGRVARFFEEERGALDGADSVAIVAHGLINRIFLSVLVGIPVQESRFFLQDNTAVNVFEWGRRRVHVRAWNIVSHAKELSC
jgi:broad specificity phosphatase PhoE